MRSFYGKCFFAPEKEEGIEPEEGVEPPEGEEAAEPEEGDEPPEGEEGVEPEEGDGTDPLEAPRKENRVQRLANEARDARERAIRAEARADAVEKYRPADTGEAARIRGEKLSLMSPEEKRIFLLEERNDKLEQGQQLTQLQMGDYADRSAYNTIAIKDTPQGKYYAKKAEDVEAALAHARRNGNNPTREAIVKLMFASDAFNAKPSKKMLAKKAEAAGRVNGSKSTPTSARGDVGSKADKDDSLDAIRSRILDREARGDM